ncbi:PilZ domain-containing protein [Sedimenticola hydrogenitrophicus]|uniref:PilZ domain-containing protein n=1 Tax=Sedimenticola hydrogenitrophicus TaxID=2967975 RepID=UPI0021A7CF36|nr:PilZ domain-containing protein [Sedimenticola hydrogenitrophicus]
MEHRIGQRIEVDRKVVLRLTDRCRIDGRLMDISLSGAAIKCKDWNVFNAYTPVEVLLESGDGREPEKFRIQGFVVRLQKGLIGVMFMKEMVKLVRRLRSSSTKSGDHWQRESLARTGS